MIESQREVWRVQVHVTMDLCIHSLVGQMWGYVDVKVTGSNSGQLLKDVV